MSQAAILAFLDAARNDVVAAMATVLDGPHIGAHLFLDDSGTRTGSLGAHALDESALVELLEALQRLTPKTLTLAAGERPVPVFIDVTSPSPRLIVVGGVHTAIHLIALANVLHFRTILIDNRTAFATRERFGHASEIVSMWPADALAALHIGAGDAIVFLSHDEKLDNPALACALSTPARYIGALGSRRTHEKRLAALRELGCSEESFARIHAPIGLDIGARTPEEIALAILGEVVASKYGRTLQRAETGSV